MQRIQQHLVSWIVSSVVQVADVSPESISTALLQGAATLEDVHVKIQRLNSFLPEDTPLELIGGTVHELSISVPWLTLSARPIEVKIDGVVLTLAPPSGERSSSGGTSSSSTSSDERVLSAKEAEKLEAIITAKLTLSEIIGIKLDDVPNTLSPSDIALTHPSDEEYQSFCSESVFSGGDDGFHSCVDADEELDGEDPEGARTERYRSCFEDRVPEDAVSPAMEEGIIPVNGNGHGVVEEVEGMDGEEVASPAARLWAYGTNFLSSAASAVIPKGWLEPRRYSADIQHIEASIMVGQYRLRISIGAVLASVVPTPAAAATGNKAASNSARPAAHTQKQTISLNIEQFTVVLEKAREEFILVKEFSASATIDREAVGTIPISQVADIVLPAIQIAMEKTNLVHLLTFLRLLQEESLNLSTACRKLLLLRYQRKLWPYAIGRVLEYVREKNRRWGCSLDSLMYYRRLRTQYQASIEAVLTDPSQFVWQEPILARYEKDIGHRDVVEHLREVVRNKFGRTAGLVRTMDVSSSVSPTAVTSNASPTDLVPKSSLLVQARVESVTVVLPSNVRVMVTGAELTAQVLASNSEVVSTLQDKVTTVTGVVKGCQPVKKKDFCILDIIFPPHAILSTLGTTYENRAEFLTFSLVLQALRVVMCTMRLEVVTNAFLFFFFLNNSDLRCV